VREYVDRSGNDRQDIVEVVKNTASDLSDERHAFALTHRHRRAGIRAAMG
jgi:hypothetical protein